MTTATCDRCETLPSAKAALSLVQGNLVMGGAAAVGSTLFRALLIAAGLYAVGHRKRVLVSAMAGACAVEVFVLGHAAVCEHSKSGAPT